MMKGGRGWGFGSAPATTKGGMEMKRILTALLVAGLLLGIVPTASAQVDLIDIKIPFRNVLQNRVYGFDFYGLLPGTGWTGEIRGKHGHVLADSALGWTLSGGSGIPVGATLLTGSVNISSLSSGYLYIINATAGVTLVLNEAPTSGEYHTFVIGNANSAVTIDVAVGAGTDYSLWGADRVFTSTTSLGKVFTLYYGKTAAGAARWGITDPKNFAIPGTLDVAGAVTATGGLAVDRDNSALSFGLSADVSCLHDGTDSVCTSTVGDFYLDNVDVNDQTIFRLGTDTAATAVEIRNNSDASVFDVDGAGQVDCAGNVDATGGLDVDSDSTKVTAGVSADMTMFHDGTNSYCENNTGLLVVRNAASADHTIGRNTYVYGGAGGAAVTAGAGAGGACSAFGGAGGDAFGAFNGANGGHAAVNGGPGGAGDAALAGLAGSGGAVFVDAGAGGAGGAAVASGSGGHAYVRAGDAGAAGAGGGGNGGDVYVYAGAGGGAPGTNGTVYLGNATTASVSLDADNLPLYLGASADLTLVHNGTDSIIDSALAGADLIMKLGDDLITSIFVVENNTGTNILEVFASGAVAVTGDFSYTGHKLNQNLYPSGRISRTPGWGDNPSATVYVHGLLPQSLTGSTMLIYFPVKVGDVVLGSNQAGFAVETNALTLDAKIVTISKTDGTATELADTLDPFTQVTAGGTWEDDIVLDAPYTVTANGMVGVRFTGTTAVADTINVALVTLNVNRK